MLPKKDLVLVAHLRQNAREPLTRLSRKTGIPVSTIFDWLQNDRHKLIYKHVTLLHFEQLGFATRAQVLLRVDKKDKEEATKHLCRHGNVNTMYKINNGWDFMLECVFRSMQELEEFLEHVEERFTIKKSEVHYILHDLKREGFLADPQMIDLA